MRFLKINISSGWKLFGAFGASLIIVVIIGLIGIFQIQFLSAKVDILGSHYLPLQAASQELKVSNNLYVMEIKNYAFWKGSRYLEAARAAPDLEVAQQAMERFKTQLHTYSLHLDTIEKEPATDKAWIGKQREWVAEIFSYKKELTDSGSKVVDLVDRGEAFASVNMAVMAFDAIRHRINDFIGETIEKDVMNSVQKQILEADQAKSHAVTFLWWSLALGVFIGGQTAWLVSRNLKHELKRRRNIISEMIRTEERERQHLSAQVHDQMSQDLGALKIYLGLIYQQAGSISGQLNKEIKQSKEIITKLLDKSHNISLLLRPPSLDEIGLISSLDELISDFRRLCKTKIEFKKPEKEPKLSSESSLYLYRFTQEALTNAAKYARAKNIQIILNNFPGKVELTYQDDGKGFNYTELLRGSRRRSEDKVRLGLLSLQERAELLGGSMHVDTAVGRGTRITVVLNI